MPLLGLGMVKASSGEREAALAFYEKALSLPANTLTSYQLLGSAYMGLEEFDLAKIAFARVLEEQPEDVPTLLTLGYLHLQLGETAKALDWVEKALREDSRSAEAHYLRGLCFEYLDKSKSAERSYRRAASLDPECPDYPRAIGALNARFGRFRDAIRAYEEACELDGRSAESLLDLAFAHVGANKPKDALECFGELVEKEPDNLTAWMNIGLLYHEKLGDAEAAINAYREYLRRGGTDPRVKKWIAELQK
jgi:tetratricopeptide (TPR) repeat protein